MRRAEQAITDPAQIADIIGRARFCRLGLYDGEWPQVVPVCFGYDGRSLFIHSAPDGHKIQTLNHHPRVCVQMDSDTELVPASTPCRWSVRYRSVIGYGRAILLLGREERGHALQTIMAQYDDRPLATLAPPPAELAILRIDIERWSGKQAGQCPPPPPREGTPGTRCPS